jgi:hypothetical protein
MRFGKSRQASMADAKSHLTTLFSKRCLRAPSSLSIDSKAGLVRQLLGPSVAEGSLPGTLFLLLIILYCSCKERRLARPPDARLFGSTGSRHMMTGGNLLCILWRAYGFRTPPNSLPNPLTRDHCGVWWMQNAGLWTHNRKFSPNKSPVRALIQKGA